MLILLSPAKSLDYESPLTTPYFSQPQFLDQAQPLIDILRPMPPQAIASLMSLSDKLAVLNYERYQSWSVPFSTENARPAVMAFNGDVYDGLAARSLQAHELDWLQQHVRILSGLYGLLRPLDLMAPYRLEMGTRLSNSRGRDLYAWWRPLLTQHLREQLQLQRQPLVINCASEEYSQAVDLQGLGVPVIQPVFKDWKNGQYKIISFYAKQARGLFARFAAQLQADSAEPLQQFSLAGYRFAASESDARTWVFTRRQPE